MSSWIVVGIGGVTCGGKTTISNELCKLIPNSVIIHQDDYFHPTGSDVLEYIEEVQHYNWDVVTAIDSERLVHDVEKIISSSDGGVLLVEGTLVLNIDKLRQLCDLKYYLTLPYTTSKQRRCQKNYKIPDPPLNFDKIVWPAYLKHKEQLEQLDSRVRFIDTNDNDESTVLGEILADLSKS